MLFIKIAGAIVLVLLVLFIIVVAVEKKKDPAPLLPNLGANLVAV